MINTSEHIDITRYEELLESDYGHVDEDALKAYLSNSASYYEQLSVEEVLESFEESYQGWFASNEEFAERELEECGYLDDLPDIIAYNIDYQSVWDSTLTHDYYEIDNYYFRYTF